jgi:DNA-binding NarL/FixJ family response regulator
MGAEQIGALDSGSRNADGITVAVGRIARLVRCGLVDDLRDDPRIHVLADNLEKSSLQAFVARGSVQAVVLDESAVQSMSPPLRAIAPDIGLLAVAREPTPTYGRALLAWGVSCLDWDATSEDVREAVHLAVVGGCMFVSRSDRVEYPDWRAESLLSERERAVLSRHIEGDSYEQIALALKISVRTAKAHTASARGKLRASSKRDLLGIPLLTRDSRLFRGGETPTY